MTRLSIAERVQEDLKRKEEWDVVMGGNLSVSDEDFLRRFWDEKVAVSKGEYPDNAEFLPLGTLSKLGWNDGLL